MQWGGGVCFFSWGIFVNDAFFQYQHLKYTLGSQIPVSYFFFSYKEKKIKNTKTINTFPRFK